MQYHCDPNDGEGTLQLIDELTTNAADVQRRVLREIFDRNATTEYLRRFLDDGGAKSIEEGEFKRSVPVVDYDEVKPYIDRLANGEPSDIISTVPITELLTSSGTSGGQPKMMPSNPEDLNRKSFMYNLLVAVMNKHVSGLDQGKAMYLLFVKPEIQTPSGLMARPVLTSYYKSPQFRNRPFNRYTMYTSPDEAILCPDSRQSMYCQLLCGLVQRQEVLRVGAVFASAFLRALKFLEAHWRSLCVDIRAGRLVGGGEIVVTDEACREAVEGKFLKVPMPELADEIEKECRRESWEGIVRRLWPKTKYVDVIVTGSMAQYIPLLEFYADNLPLLSTMYASSESFFGINMEPLNKPDDVAYTLIPNMAYFEFIPVDMHSHEDSEEQEKKQAASARYPVCNGGGAASVQEQQQQQLDVVDLVDVEAGRYYELVVTTFTGLYRYRVGDILKVTGFYNSAPQFRFVQRRNVVLSVDTDKTNEEDLLKAVTGAKLLLEPLGCLLAEYTSYADTSSIPGHYVLFWELEPKVGHDAVDVDQSVMEACCETVEAALDSVYRRCRCRDGSVGPLEIRVVKCGAFDALMDFCVSHGSSVNQYKTPRCIKTKEAIELLNSRVVGRYFSKKTPVWQANKLGVVVQ